MIQGDGFAFRTLQNSQAEAGNLFADVLTGGYGYEIIWKNQLKLTNSRISPKRAAWRNRRGASKF